MAVAITSIHTFVDINYSSKKVVHFNVITHDYHVIPGFFNLRLMISLYFIIIVIHASPESYL